MIRRAADGDFAVLPEIERSAGQAFLAIPGLEWLAGNDPIPAERHRGLAEAGITLVAGEGSMLSGFVCSEPLGEGLHIVELSVRREMQGRGLGRALLAELIELAARQGLRRMSLTTFSDVPWNAPFYRSLGFREVGPPDLDAKLKARLSAEIAAGLPGSRRCAMELRLR